MHNNEQPTCQKKALDFFRTELLCLLGLIGLNLIFTRTGSAVGGSKFSQFDSREGVVSNAPPTGVFCYLTSTLLRSIYANCIPEKPTPQKIAQSAFILLQLGAFPAGSAAASTLTGYNKPENASLNTLIGMATILAIVIAAGLIGTIIGKTYFHCIQENKSDTPESPTPVVVTAAQPEKMQTPSSTQITIETDVLPAATANEPINIAEDDHKSADDMALPTPQNRENTEPYIEEPSAFTP